MKYIIPILALFFIASCSDSQMNSSNSSEAAKAELEELLDDFLHGASENNAEMHDRFWAEDLIYTSSAGERITKQDIMTGFQADTSSVSTEDQSPQYSYEDLQIMVFNDAAVVAFRLVGTTGSGTNAEEMNYYNTGTFIKRNAQWQAVAWQATRIPE